MPSLCQTAFCTPTSYVYSFGIRQLLIGLTTFRSNRQLPVIAYFFTLVLLSDGKGGLASQRQYEVGLLLLEFRACVLPMGPSPAAGPLLWSLPVLNSEMPC